MRLLNSTTLELREFPDDEIPTYAILSHTWGEEEVSFQGMKERSRVGMAGYSKIVACCATAAGNKFEYVWIDTCCIDKSSSAELSEAINSMYKWYRKAAVCYAYLVDVPADQHSQAFMESRWFTRGWTLQELIAPVEVVFYSYDWHPIGTKTEMRQTIAALTGVNVKILTGEDYHSSVSVAIRMSWASKRKTTRVEDTAYCLMGLFNVNMPLLYGEGERAFVRLQEEIMKISNDHSLFAWKEVDMPFTSGRGLLARSPAEFFHSGNIVPIPKSGPIFPTSITNHGLHIQLDMIRCSYSEVYSNATDSNSDFESESESESESGSMYLAALHCQDTTDSRGPMAIYLRQLDEGRFIRIHPNRLPAFGKIRKHGGKRFELYVDRSLYVLHNLEQLSLPSHRDFSPIYRFHIREPTSNLNHGLFLDSVYPDNQWDEGEGILGLATETSAIAGVLLFKHTSDAKARGVIVVLGIDPQFCTWCYLLSQSSKTLKEVYVKYGEKIRSSASSSSANAPKYSDTFWIKSQQLLFTVDIDKTQVGNQKMFDVCFLISKP